MKKPMINYAKREEKDDELYTPEFAVLPVLEFLKKGSTIWCPFDDESSNFVKILKSCGYNVIFTHKNKGENFLKVEKEYNNIYKIGSKLINLEKIDYIVSNPPFSIKNEILKKLYELGKPFAMLLPLTALEGVFRNNLYKKYGLEILVLDKRINFLEQKKSNWFNTSYFCWNILPKQLIFKKIDTENKNEKKN